MIQLVYVQAILMDNGEVITVGKRIGYEKDLGKYIYKESEVVITRKTNEEEK